MGSPSQIHAFDPGRLFLGQAPWSFLGEVALRGLVIYVVLLVAIRLMGKRVAGQMTMSELAVIVTLGAAIGVPMQVPQNGLLPGIVIRCVAVAFQRAVALASIKARTLETLTQGDLEVLVDDGVLALRRMRHVGLTRERLFAALRENGVAQLGEVHRVYIEASGGFSIFRGQAPRPGLRIVPRDHGGLCAVVGRAVCRDCGATGDDENVACETCGVCKWEPAVLGRRAAS